MLRNDVMPLTLMRFLVAVATVALVVACGGPEAESPTAPAVAGLGGLVTDHHNPDHGGGPGGGGGNGGGDDGGGGKAAYDVTFSGDMESDSFAATLSTSDPFKKLDADPVLLRFVAATGDTSVCDANNGSPTSNDWGDYAGKDWTGSLEIQQRGSLTHLGFSGKSADGGDINLVVNHDGAGETNDGSTATLTFDDAVAKLGSTSVPSAGADPDATDRCVDFVVTAVRR